ncbi:phage protein [Erythrobacter dokdonensis DSW-74]|uniref:Phage protein n=2 Tax=Erythrobacter TaxID=1041 RepID=A0A1A7BBN4_9SPHN|nr:phage protein [Erythrobacter dokdonensis DSW-74]
MRVFFDRELDTVATFWRIFRRDGVMLAFTSHDRDLAFGGITHRAAPGMVPAAIRLTADISSDSAEAEGALNHDAIREDDLAAGLFDNAAIEIGAVDWTTLEHHALYTGRIGRIEDDQSHFSAELRSDKHLLEQDLVPRTSPTCRAEFCGRGCGLSAARFTSTHKLSDIDLDRNRVRFATLAAADHIDGRLRFLNGAQTGVMFDIIDIDDDWLVLDRPLVDGTAIGTKAELREGCDHTIATCSERFNNARNFRGEPFLPGNDLLSRYGQSS